MHSNFTNCPNDDLYRKRKSWITSCIQLLHVFNLGRFFDFTLSFTTLAFFTNTGQSVTLQTIPPVCVMRFWQEYYISNAEFFSVHLFGKLLVTTHPTTGDINFLISWLRWCLPGLSPVRHPCFHVMNKYLVGWYLRFNKSEFLFLPTRIPPYIFCLDELHLHLANCPS